jgi:hypothetical protein
VASYQIPLCAGTQTGVTSRYLTEKESEEPSSFEPLGCTGSQNEPSALPGNVCLFTASDPGATEAQWKHVKFVRMEEPDAVASTTSGRLGVRAVFQTTGFNTAATGTIPAGGAYLAAGGAWAVTAP